ncbi:hypothetical protein BK146_17900 [Paenibacillus sp. FSL R7-0333]|nr:hypothetical protein BK146_17900 [Paenibacillus sp. FSL R7-0333]
MSSGVKRHRSITPINPTYPNLVDTSRWDTRDTTYVLSEEQLAEVIAKYGPPKMPLRKTGNHFRGFKKKGEGKDAKQVRSKKDAS